MAKNKQNHSIDCQSLMKILMSCDDELLLLVCLDLMPVTSIVSFDVGININYFIHGCFSGHVCKHAIHVYLH